MEQEQISDLSVSFEKYLYNAEKYFIYYQIQIVRFCNKELIH